MRTTISLDDRLLGRLKKHAADSGTSVSRLIEQSARLFLRTPETEPEAEPFELVTYGAGGSFSRHNIDKTSALIETDDVERFGEHE